MTQSDDPFERNGKTVIRPRPGGASAGSDGFSNDVRPLSPQTHSTVISPQAFSPAGFPQPRPAQTDRATDFYETNWTSPAFANQPRPTAPGAQPRAKIPLSVALGGRSSPEITSSNPITQAAVPLLILLGRLRQMVVEMDAVPLMQHVARTIAEFEKKILAAGVPADQATIAKYALCATADDIVQNLPGTEKQVWLQYSMLAQFFSVRTSGTGFFDKIRQLSSNPTVYYDLLELIHACLSLGFEGQYRSAMGGDIELQRVRRDVYTTLRSVRGGAGADISPRWRGVQTRVRGISEGVPLWAIASVFVAALAGLYMLLRFFIVTDGDAAADTLVHLHPTTDVIISRDAFTPLPEPDPPAATETQLERIRTVLRPEIEKDLIAVDAVGESIVIRINNLLLFDSGKAEVKKDFDPLAERVAEALDKEPGNIHIVGHTDNVKLKSSSRFKSNFDLSVKRAEAVSAALARHLQDAARIDVTGKGEDDPVESNATAAGRAKNRRVDLAIPREETLSN